MATKKKIKPLREGEVINMGCGGQVTVVGVWTGISETANDGLLVHLEVPLISGNNRLAISGEALEAIRLLLERAEVTRKRL